MPKKAAIFFFDTVVLSNFSLTGNFKILIDSYQKQLAITYEVYNEIAQGITRGFTELTPVVDYFTASTCTRYTLNIKEKKLYRDLLSTLGSGEASCVAAAYTNSAIVVSDDKKARSCCTDLTVSFTGTIGILTKLCKTGAIAGTNADSILEKMISAGFYSPVDTISELL
jgi:predicted nucleic acid-binding protein